MLDLALLNLTTTYVCLLLFQLFPSVRFICSLRPLRFDLRRYWSFLFFRTFLFLKVRERLKTAITRASQLEQELTDLKANYPTSEGRQIISVSSTDRCAGKTDVGTLTDLPLELSRCHFISVLS